MSASFFDMMKYAKTGLASAEMSNFDKLRALAAFGGEKTQTLTGVPPLSFRANGKPLTSWTVQGNEKQKSANLNGSVESGSGKQTNGYYADMNQSIGSERISALISAINAIQGERDGLTSR